MGGGASGKYGWGGHQPTMGGASAKYGGAISQVWGGHQPSMGGHQSSMGGSSAKYGGGHQPTMGGASAKYGGYLFSHQYVQELKIQRITLATHTSCLL